MFPILQVLVGW